MTGTLIKIAGNGPGTGPIIPKPLYTLASSDYMLRWEAQRITGADGAAVTSWRDVMSDLVLSGANVNLRSPGDGAYLSFPQGVGQSLEAATTALPADITVALLFRAGGGTIVNNGIVLDGWRVGRAGNGGLQVSSDSAFYAGTTVPLDTWNVALFSLSASAPANTRAKLNGNAPGGPGQIAAAPTASLDKIGLGHGSTATGRLEVASLVIWPRAMTSAQMQAEYEAIVAGSPLI